MWSLKEMRERKKTRIHEALFVFICWCTVMLSPLFVIDVVGAEVALPVRGNSQHFTRSLLDTQCPTSHPSTQPTRRPSGQPSRRPSGQPSMQPSRQPTAQPSRQPTRKPSGQPSRQPTAQPSMQPSRQPTSQPSRRPSSQPSCQPSRQPSSQPSSSPTRQPSMQPSRQPTAQPSMQPSRQPTSQPSRRPSSQPSSQPSRKPSGQPSRRPTCQPSMQPSRQPTAQPSLQPSRQPSGQPSSKPSKQPSTQPTRRPTGQPSSRPSKLPSAQPSRQPSNQPSAQPSKWPTAQPSIQPSRQPTSQPSLQPSTQPSFRPSQQPSSQPTQQPTTQPSSRPSCQPSSQPSIQPSGQPSTHPSMQPSGQPSIQPSNQPSSQPTQQPTTQPSSRPSSRPSGQPTIQPSMKPSAQPSMQPNSQPSVQPTSQPSSIPTQPSGVPTSRPSNQPSSLPSTQPSSKPTMQPSSQPNSRPTSQPSLQPSSKPSRQPSRSPSMQPSLQPTAQPSGKPTQYPTCRPTLQPSAQPSMQPSSQPFTHPTNQPSSQPTAQPNCEPSNGPTGQPSLQPSSQPSSQPSLQPSMQPSRRPSSQPSRQPSSIPTRQPSGQPSMQPSTQPSAQPTLQPSKQPSSRPSRQPSAQPSMQPSSQPSMQPSNQPSSQPSMQPSRQPSSRPSAQPSSQPSMQPSSQPVSRPSAQPSRQPLSKPSGQPSSQPSSRPSSQPSRHPSRQPSSQPSMQPSSQPNSRPTSQPSRKPSSRPSRQPSAQPSMQPSTQPSGHPSAQPSTQPSMRPSMQPSRRPSSQPSMQPSMLPSCQPSRQPSGQPSSQPVLRPTSVPSTRPTSRPSMQPTRRPSSQPSRQPLSRPSMQPSRQPSSHPSSQPSMHPTGQPSKQPTSNPSRPSSQPSSNPSMQPSRQPTTQPSHQPLSHPSIQPSSQPSSHPSSQPSSLPTGQPSDQPSSRPSMQPSRQPTTQPSSQPSRQPSMQPSRQPSRQPSSQPLRQPTRQPSSQPTSQPSSRPTTPSSQPTTQPSGLPTGQPTSMPSTHCFPGKYSHKQRCHLCRPGTYTDTFDEHWCKACPLGSFSHFGQSVCTLCDYGFYAAHLNSTSCTPCPHGHVGTIVRIRTTTAPGAVSADMCYTPSDNFGSGLFSLVVVAILSVVHIFFGRFRRVAFLRDKRVLANLIDICRRAEREIWKFLVEKDQEKREEMKSVNQPAEANPLLAWLFILLCTFFVLLLAIFSLAFSLLAVFFKSLILSKAYAFQTDFSFLEKLSEITLNLESILGGLSFVTKIMYPISALIGALSKWHVDLASINVTCEGSSAPTILLIDVMVLGAVIIIIESNYEFFRVVSLQNLMNKFFTTATQPAYLNELQMPRPHGLGRLGGFLRFLRNFAYIGLAESLVQTDILMSGLRYLMTFVQISSFTKYHGGAHLYSPACNTLEGAKNFDSGLDFFASTFAWLLLVPVLYEIGKVFVPGLPAWFLKKQLREGSNLYGENLIEFSKPGSFIHRAFFLSRVSLKLPSIFAPDLWLVQLVQSWIVYIEESFLFERSKKKPGFFRNCCGTCFTRTGCVCVNLICQTRYREETEEWKELSGPETCTPITQLPNYFQLCVLERQFLLEYFTAGCEATWQQWLLVRTVKGFLASVLAASGLGHFFTNVGRDVIRVVVWKYYTFLRVCFGLWTDEFFENYEVQYLMMKMSVPANKFIEYPLASHAKVVVKDLDYAQALSALISTRAIILQVVPQLTALSIFISEISSTPVFGTYLSPRLKKKLPERYMNLEEARRVAEGREYEALVPGQLVDREGKDWIISVLSVGIKWNESMWIQFTLSVFRFIVSIGIIAYPNSFDWLRVSVIIFFLNGFFQCPSLVVALGKFMGIKDQDLHAATNHLVPVVLQWYGAVCLLCRNKCRSAPQATQEAATEEGRSIPIQKFPPARVNEDLGLDRAYFSSAPHLGALAITHVDDVGILQVGRSAKKTGLLAGAGGGDVGSSERPPVREDGVEPTSKKLEVNMEEAHPATPLADAKRYSAAIVGDSDGEGEDGIAEGSREPIGTAMSNADGLYDTEAVYDLQSSSLGDPKEKIYTSMKKLAEHLESQSKKSPRRLPLADEVGQTADPKTEVSTVTAAGGGRGDSETREK